MWSFHPQKRTLARRPWDWPLVRFARWRNPHGQGHGLDQRFLSSGWLCSLGTSGDSFGCDHGAGSGGDTAELLARGQKRYWTPRSTLVSPSRLKRYPASHVSRAEAEEPLGVLVFQKTSDGLTKLSTPHPHFLRAFFLEHSLK